MNTNYITHSLHTERLVLINSSSQLLKQLLNSEEAMQDFLEISIPEHWTEFGQAPFEYALEQIENHNSDPMWWSWLPVLTSENMLIGNCGYKGPPENGMVEIGYEVARDYREQGFATEMAEALIQNAFDDPRVNVIIAHTLAEENASVKILRNCGFTFAEEIQDPEDGTIWKWVKLRSTSWIET